MDIFSIFICLILVFYQKFQKCVSGHYLQEHGVTVIRFCVVLCN